MRRVMMIVAALILGLVLVGGACAPKAPEAASPADFYANNKATLWCPYPPGGGTDYAARTFAAFWPDATGGGAMVVDSSKLGGAGLEMANYLYNNAKPDGLSLGIQPVSGKLLEWFFENPGVDHVYKDFQFMGYFIHEAFVVGLAAGSPHADKSLEELLKVEGLKFGTGSGTSTQGVGVAVAAELLGLKNAQLIYGIKGTAGLGVAAGRGEIDGTCNNASSMMSQVPKMFSKVLVVVDRERSPECPDVPAITEVVKLTPEQEELLDMYLYFGMSGKCMYTTPDTPKDRVEFLRAAFMKVMNDEAGFQKQMKLRYKVLVPPRTGEDIAKAVATVQDTPREKLALFRQAIDKYMPVKK